MKVLVNSRVALLAILVAAGISVFLSINAANAQSDWPQWRGPNRDGHSLDTGLLKKWPEGGPKLVWKATGLGAGFTSASVVGDRLFALGDLGDADYLIALNRADGKILWKTKVGKSGAVGWGNFPGPRGEPTVDENRVFAISQYDPVAPSTVHPKPLDVNRVYAVSQYGAVLCADAASGAAIWRKDYETDFGGRLPEWGFSGMPLMDGERVILMPGGDKGDLVALDKETGKLIWQSKELTDSIHYSSPILVEIGGVRQIIQLTDASLAGIRASDGHLLWRVERKGSTAVIPTPIYHEGQVYVTSGYGAGCNLVKITAENGKFSARQVYANKVMTNHHGGVILVGKYLYGYSDSEKGWVCQDFQTGKSIWREKGIGKGSLTYADGLFYLRGDGYHGNSRTVAIIEATPDGYKELSHFDPPDASEWASWAHPVVTGGRLYLRDQDVLQCYDVRGK